VRYVKQEAKIYLSIYLLLLVLICIHFLKKIQFLVKYS